MTNPLDVQSLPETGGTNHMIVTQIGAALLKEKGADIGITSFRFANGFSYVPEQDQTAFKGKLTGVEEASAPEVVTNQLVYNIVIPPDINFDFGEIGLFVGHKMVALIVENSLIPVRFGGQPVTISCALPLPSA